MPFQESSHTASLLSQMTPVTLRKALCSKCQTTVMTSFVLETAKPQIKSLDLVVSTKSESFLTSRLTSTLQTMIRKSVKTEIINHYISNLTYKYQLPVFSVHFPMYITTIYNFWHWCVISSFNVLVCVPCSYSNMFQFCIPNTHLLSIYQQNSCFNYDAL